MEHYQPHVALGVEDFHSRLALVELEVVEELVELVEEVGDLTLHSWLVVPLLDFFSKCFLLIASIAVAFGDGTT